MASRANTTDRSPDLLPYEPRPLSADLEHLQCFPWDSLGAREGPIPRQKVQRLEPLLSSGDAASRTESKAMPSQLGGLSGRLRLGMTYDSTLLLTIESSVRVFVC